jgi:hypothetical protein
MAVEMEGGGSNRKYPYTGSFLILQETSQTVSIYTLYFGNEKAWSNVTCFREHV